MSNRNKRLVVWIILSIISAVSAISLPYGVENGNEICLLIIYLLAGFGLGYLYDIGFNKICKLLKIID